MQLSTYIVVAAIEIYILLVVIGIVLFFQGRRQRQLILRQHEKLQYLIAQLRKLKLPPAPVIAGGANYLTYIKAQLAATRNRYAGVAPDIDITKPLTSESPAQQQALALRYNYLLAEEAAVANGDGPIQLDWDVFERYLCSANTGNESSSFDSELDAYKKRVENLEKFKQLFFNMEEKWQDAHLQAKGYHHQLSLMTEGVSDQERFIEVLDSYQKVYQELDGTFAHGRESVKEAPDHTANLQNQNSLTPLSTEEIRKLRNVAADQHRIINQLQRQLEEAITAEDKAAVISELQQQLQRQTRFVQESETCVRLLEEELAGAMEKVNKQQQQLQTAMEISQENNRLKEVLQNFTLESKSLTATILDLEKENDDLKGRIQRAKPSTPPPPTKGSLENVNQVRAELQALKNQYVELESKYLDLKLKN